MRELGLLLQALFSWNLELTINRIISLFDAELAAFGTQSEWAFQPTESGCAARHLPSGALFHISEAKPDLELFIHEIVARTHRTPIQLQRDDLVSGTFVYQLHENAIFDTALCAELIATLSDDTDPADVAWLIAAVDAHFSYHHDESDLFVIRNYTAEVEDQWRTVFKPQLAYRS